MITSCISTGMTCKCNETEGEKGCKRLEVKEGKSERQRRGREREAMLLEEMRKSELTERFTERENERERERKGGILKAAVTPVTSHLSNPAPT